MKKLTIVASIVVLAILLGFTSYRTIEVSKVTEKSMKLKSPCR